MVMVVKAMVMAMKVGGGSDGDDSGVVKLVRAVVVRCCW